jgi:hypothetical protein
MSDTATHIYARPDRFRAIVALVAPFLLLAAVVVVLLNKGHSLADYPRLVMSGKVSPISQIVGWTCLIFWIARYWPGAIDALSSNFVLARAGNSIVNAKGESVEFSSIKDVTLRQSVLRKEIVIETDGGSVRQGIVFAQTPARDLLNLVRNDATHSA